MKKFFKKHYKKVSIMIVTLLLSFTLMTQEAHAYTVEGIYVESSVPLYYGAGSTSEYSIFQYQLYSTPNTVYYGNLGLIMSELVGFDSTTRIYSFRTDVLNYVEVKYPTVQRFYLPDLQYLVVEDGTRVSSPYPIATFIDVNGAEILTFDYDEYTNSLPTTNPINIRFEILTYDYEFYNVAYNNGYNTGYDIGIFDGRALYGYYDTSTSTWLTGAEARLQGYDLGKMAFGYFDTGTSTWITAVAYGEDEYDRGLGDGLLESNQESYDRGFVDGGNASFVGNIHNWIVPAIIIVLFLGGAVTVFMRKRE